MLTDKQKIKLYKNMVRVRKTDECLVKAFNDGKLAGPSFHSQQGQEAIGVGTCTFLRKDDYLIYTHRGHGVCELLSKGLPIKIYLAEHFGKVTGSCKGIGFINHCELEFGFFGMGGTVGGEFTIGAGIALAAKMIDKQQVVAVFMGDGATGRGSLHEAMLMSSNWKLPVLWLCSNNGMAMWVPTKIAYPKDNLVDLAFGYGIPGEIVDGQDVIAVYDSVQAAVNKARSGLGPSFLEFKTCRFRTHHEAAADICQDRIRSQIEVAAWKQRDPIKLFCEKLMKENLLTQNEVIRIENDVSSEIEEALKFAEGSAIPTPDILDKALYAD
jgi:TPP-dependent pyruvate/acetoin dehydrogenase alpha subunit